MTQTSATTPSAPPVGGSSENASLSPSLPVGSAPPPDLVFPPADLRGVIDKTAQFVAKNGVEFEQRVLREQSASKFGFLLPSNPYNAFYKLKVREFMTGVAAPTPQVPQAIQDLRAREQQQQQKQQQLLMLTQVSAAEAEAEEKLEPPPADVFTLTLPWVAPIDLDIIRATAQFVARNGQKFLAGLAQREQQNPQFAFLKPSHNLFAYFTGLVDAYTRCLLPPQQQLDLLKTIAGSPQQLLQRVMQRVRWEKQQRDRRREKENKSHEERQQMQKLDWSSFHVLETIDFTEEDEKIQLAAPIDFKAPVREAPKLLDQQLPPQQSIAELIEEAAGAEEEMDTDEDEQTGRSREKPLKEPSKESEVQETSAPPADASQKPALRIVQGYVRSRRRQTAVPSGLQKCPITGALVRAEDMSEHLRILLLDPKWKEQRERLLEKLRAESAFAPLEDVEANLALFVSKRPDLFGSVEEHARQEAEAEDAPASHVASEAEGASYDPAAVPAVRSEDQNEEPAFKRQRVATEPTASAVAAAAGLVLVTVCCIEGGGLEEQEAQVEVDGGLTAAQLKQSLIDAGIGPEGMRARNLQLADAESGTPILDHVTLRAFGIKPTGSKLTLKVVTN